MKTFLLIILAWHLQAATAIYKLELECGAGPTLTMTINGFVLSAECGDGDDQHGSRQAVVSQYLHPGVNLVGYTYGDPGAHDSARGSMRLLRMVPEGVAGQYRSETAWERRFGSLLDSAWLIDGNSAGDFRWHAGRFDDGALVPEEQDGLYLLDVALEDEDEAAEGVLDHVALFGAVPDPAMTYAVVQLFGPEDGPVTIACDVVAGERSTLLVPRGDQVPRDGIDRCRVALLQRPPRSFMTMSLAFRGTQPPASGAVPLELPADTFRPNWTRGAGIDAIDQPARDSMYGRIGALATALTGGDLGSIADDHFALKIDDQVRCFGIDKDRAVAEMTAFLEGFVVGNEADVATPGDLRYRLVNDRVVAVERADGSPPLKFLGVDPADGRHYTYSFPLYFSLIEGSWRIVL